MRSFCVPRDSSQLKYRIARGLCALPPQNDLPTSKYFKMETRSMVVDTPQLINGVPVKMEVKQYVPGGPKDPAGGLTLVLAHGTTSYKEMWEPAINALFQYQTDHPKVRPIREVWSLEWPSHGESAVLNEQILRSSGVVITSREWAEAIADFVQKRLGSHRVLCIAHSVGAYAVLNSTRSLSGVHGVPYQSIVVIEPGIIHRHAFQAHSQERRTQLNTLADFAKKRRQEWGSRDEALSYLKQRAPWNSWDARVLDLFTNYGLRLKHTGETRVTLKCPAHTAAETCSDVEIEQSIQAMDQLEALAERVPIHAIVGEYNDLIPPYYNDCFTDLGNRGKVASVTVLPEAGHSIPEEEPDALAGCLWRIILQHTSRSQLGDIHRPGTFGRGQSCKSRL